jgi:hypothetical protein
VRYAANRCPSEDLLYYVLLEWRNWRVRHPPGPAFFRRFVSIPIRDMLMLRLTPWLVLALLIVPPTQLLQASSLTSGPALPAPAWETTLQADDARARSLTQIQPSEQVTPTVRPPQPTIRSPLGSITRTVFSEATTPVTVTVPLTPTRPATTTAPTTTPSTTTTVTETEPITTTATPTVSAPGPAAVDPAGPIQGTIIANRTPSLVRFFAEGQTYDLAPLRSQGLVLARETTVLNLFNCDADEPQSEECYWDPYALNRDGFYEIVTGREAGKAVGLVLQEAGAPPVNQIWVQNRLGTNEVIFYNNQEYQLPPSTVQEFAGQPGVPVTLYVRSCLVVGETSVCEWYPQNVETGVYYALTELATTGAVPGSRMQMVQLEPVVSQDPEEPAEVVEAPTQFLCTLVVPTLNVRSGPGLEYEILTKVRGTESEPGNVLIVGRDPTSQWLAVDERVAAGGWITGSPDFVNCDGDVAALPEAEITDGRLASTPATATGTETGTAVEETAPVTGTEPVAAEGTVTETTPAAGQPIETTIPDGQALLIVNNGFDQVIRFTLDQRFRVEQGPSEYDLQPGQSISIAVYPGQIAFTASSPWRSLSGNADFFLESKQSRPLWLIFVPDPDGSGNWLLQY